MKLTRDHAAAVREAAEAIRDGIALSVLHPPAEEKAASELRAAAARLRYVCERLDEVALEVSRSAL